VQHKGWRATTEDVGIAEIAALSESVVAFFEKFGVDLAASRSRQRIFCRPCLDWTERRQHLGGAVGAVQA
jgi:hypothetical protein